MIGANDLAKAEPIAATLYQKDSESTGVKLISLKQTRLNTAMLTVSLLGMANLQVLFMSMMFNSSSLILTTGVL